MRWDDLFDDLETQLERELTAEELDLEIEEERLRLGRLSVRDRLMALHESQGGGAYRLALTLGSGERLSVHPVAFGRDWFSADVTAEGSRTRQCIVPIGALLGVGLEAAVVPRTLEAARAADGHPSLSARLGLAFVLRDLCRRRRAVDLVLSSGELHGTLDRIGRDHVDLAVHDRDAPRRESEVREIRIVPFAALQLVRL
ncbi:MAG: hypothetical protein JWR04_1999 [Rhodoglobus sp.]|jgi:hypothetical protein|nr:hypothetical protein [Rhodoglobus sp.]